MVLMMLMSVYFKKLNQTVEFDENKLGESQIFEAVDKAGYKAQNIGEKQVSNVQEDEDL